MIMMMKLSRPMIFSLGLFVFLVETPRALRPNISEPDEISP